MTTTHDTSISWTDCPVCAGLRRELEYASEKAQNAWRTYDSLDAEYRMAMDDGRLGFGTTAWSQWRDLLDDLLHQYYAAEDAKRARLAAWGDSIRNHDKPQTQEAATETDDAAQERPTVACVLFDTAYRLTGLAADTTDNPDAKLALAGINVILLKLGYIDDDGRRVDRAASMAGKGESK